MAANLSQYESFFEALPLIRGMEGQHRPWGWWLYCALFPSTEQL